MSITKGAMLISNANAVGTELVNQLGGTGYKPVEWADKINLLGINSADAPYAIKSIQAGTYTGEERGAIQYSNCNAVGSMLNKKLNTNRGFKPVEWPSSINVLKPLTENTVTGDICNVSDGSEQVPLKSWSVNIPANLSGKSTVVCTEVNNNLVNVADVSGSITNAYFYNIGTDYTLTANVTYKIAMEVNSTVTPFAVSVGVGDNVYMYDIYNTGINNKNGLVTFEFTVDASHVTTWNKLWIRAPRYSAPSEPATPTTCTFTVKNITLYTTATVNTVDLGRTVYGADVDVVGGTCEPLNLVSLNRSPAHSKINYGVTVNTQTENKLNMTTTGVAYACERLFYSLTKGTYTAKHTSTSSDGFSAKIAIYKYPSSTVIANSFASGEERTFTLTEDTDIDIRLFASGNSDTTIRTVEFTDFRIEKGSTVGDYSPYFEPFTFDPITPTPETNTSVKNFWNDTGSNTITYYQAPTALTRSTVSGSIASFSDADTRLTCVNAIATIPPSIAGVDTVQLVRVGKNFVNGTNFTRGLPSTTIGASIDTITASNRYEYFDINTGGEVMTVSSVTNDIDSFNLVLIFGYKNGVLTYYSNTQPGTDKTVDFTDCDFIRIGAGAKSGVTVPTDLTDYGTIQLEVGSTSSTYTPYQTPTTYTANLPSTNHGGSVDFVNGDVVGTHATVDMGSLTWTYHPASGSLSAYFDTYLPLNAKVGNNQVPFDGVSENYTSIPSSQIALSGHDDMVMTLGNDTRRFFLCDQRYTNKDDLTTALNGQILAYPLTTPTTASITGQAIIPKTGTNNCYNNVGGNTEITYFTNT